MKNFLTPLVSAVSAKQITVVVALITTAFVIVQASSAPRNKSANIDDGSDLANSAIAGADSLSRIAAGEPAMNSPAPITTAASSPGIAAQAVASTARSTPGMRAPVSSFSANDRSRPSAEIGQLASNRPLTSQAFALSSIGSASGLSSSSRATSANEMFGGDASSGSGGGSSGSFASNPVPANTRPDALANSIFETPISTALANTNNSLTGLSSDRPREPAQSYNPAVEDIALHETSGSPASNPLDFSSAIGDTTLDLMGMKIGDLETSLTSAISSADDDVTPVAAVPEAGHTFWLLSAAMVGLMAYGQRFSCRRHGA